MGRCDKNRVHRDGYYDDDDERYSTTSATGPDASTPETAELPAEIEFPQFPQCDFTLTETAYHIGNYVFTGQTLGQGSAGPVVKMQARDGSYVAVKVFVF